MPRSLWRRQSDPRSWVVMCVVPRPRRKCACHSLRPTAHRPTDPQTHKPLYWIPNKYTTTSEGDAELNWVKDSYRGDIGGELYIVHNATEYFSAVGILIQQTSDVWPVTTAEVNTSGVSGSAAVFTTDAKVVVAGKVSGLSADVTDCSLTNGCGVYVRSGTSCDSTSTHGGPYFHGLGRHRAICFQRRNRGR